jgi:hypothetical protein
MTPIARLMVGTAAVVAMVAAVGAAAQAKPIRAEVSAAIVAVSASPPSVAAASCYIICDGQDPSTGVYEDSSGVLRPCNDGRTIYEASGDNGTYVQLRYSGKCRMAWARTFSASQIRVDGFNANGTYRVQYFSGSGAPNHYTVAVNDAGLTARACIAKGSGWSCTVRY